MKSRKLIQQRPAQALHRRFLILANAKDHEVSESAVVPRNANLVSFMPHMHYRGKHMKFIGYMRWQHLEDVIE